jgi:L-ascorbate metabolism protein UlaG (beta-lactamase superfamily)
MLRPLFFSLAAVVLMSTQACPAGKLTGQAFEDNRLRLATNAPQHGLTVRWFGAASIVIDDGTTALLIDPFVTRGDYSKLRLFSKRGVEIDTDAVKAFAKLPDVGRTKAILVSHSHYDHVMDVPAFAKHLTKAKIYGSKDAFLVVEGHDNTIDTARLRPIEPGKPFTVGPFEIEAVVSRHGKPLGGPLNPLADAVVSPLKTPAALKDYGLGDIYAFRISHPSGTIVHIGSAGVTRETTTAFRQWDDTDLLLLSLVGRGKTASYLSNTVGLLNPGYVVPMHYDDIFDSLDAPVNVTFVAKLTDFFRTMKDAHQGVTTGTIQFHEGWRLNDGRLGLAPPLPLP